MNNPYFPMGYQALYPQYQMPQNQGFPVQMPERQPQQNNSIIWVQGEAGAKSYLLGPNQTVQLWDSESQTIYLKSSDSSGMPSLKILDYTIRDEKQPAQNAQERSNFDSFVTKDDLHSLEEKILKRLDKLTKETDNE